MKLAFFGTPGFAEVALRRLLETDHEIALVVTQPDKPAGRGRKLTAPPVKSLALSEGLEVAQPESVRTPEFADRIAALELDAAIVVAYGKILPAALLGIPRFGFLNIHGSLLPKYRGAAPIQWAIVRGETVTGVTIMQIDEGLDSGPVVSTREVEILEDDDARSLYDILAFTGAELLEETLGTIEREGRVDSTPQNDGDATLAPLIRREDARIDWTQPTDRIICAVRGFALWPGAHSKIGDTTIKILAAEAVDPSWIELDWKDERIPPGMVVDVVKGRGFAVKTGSGLLLATRIQPQGKKEMDAVSALNGGIVDVGNRFAD